ncbi:MAG: DMT family transporter [Chitinophagaceae bacterium]|nr:DMT family transporter [Chitinophagaceae bacterium]
MRKAFIQLHLAVFLAGLTGILGRLIELNAALLVWWRLLISAVTMWILFALMKKLHRLSKKDIMKVAGVGVIASLHWVTFFASIKYSTVSVALVCFSAVGFFTAILEPLITGRKFRAVELLLGLLVMAGIFIIFHFDPAYKTGILVGLVSAFLGSIFPICNGIFVKRMNTETLMTYELTGGLLALTVLMPVYVYLFPTNYFFPTSSDWGWLLILAWLCSVWAFQLSANALKKISAFTVNLTYNLEPVYGIILAFLVYQENELLTGGFYAGLSLILLAVVLQTIRVYRDRKNPSAIHQNN